MEVYIRKDEGPRSSLTSIGGQSAKSRSYLFSLPLKKITREHHVHFMSIETKVDQNDHMVILGVTKLQSNLFELPLENLFFFVIASV